MAGMTDTGGSVRFFSQFRTVEVSTPIRAAAWVWDSPRSMRARLICSPGVCGSKSVSFGFKALSVTDTHGRKATRPCPCGWLGHAAGKCRCTPDQIARYRGKLSGPLLDRIDLMLDVPAVAEDELSARGDGESSSTVRERVVAARDRQLARQGKPNAQLTPDEVDRHCLPDCAGAALLKQAMRQLGLSARAYHRILKLARTIADLAGVADGVPLSAAHVAEAVHYRRGLAH